MMTFADNYFSRRRGQVPLSVLLWRDMPGVGTVINLTATLLALAVIVQDAPDWLAVRADALQYFPVRRAVAHAGPGHARLSHRRRMAGCHFPGVKSP